MKDNSLKKELKEAGKKERKPMNTNGLSGIALLFICVSIGYADYIVFFGTTSLVSKIMLVPSGLFVAYYLVNKFIK